VIVDAAIAHQRLDVRRRLPLAGEWSGFMDARVERMNRTAQRIDRHRRGDIGRTRHLFGRRQRQRQDRGGGLRAVDEREPFFRPEANRVEARAAQRLRARDRRHHFPWLLSGAPRVLRVCVDRLRLQRLASPMSTSARCASGARSPLAPTEPREGTSGVTPLLSRAISASSVST
jgi:hypothetical protein